MAQLTGVLQQRSDKVAFLGLPSAEDDSLIFTRMQGFTSLSVSKNPQEYSRQYVDETQEHTDVTGYSPSMDFSFDKYAGNPVHDFITDIIDSEIIGTAAVAKILTVDLTQTENNAKLRSYAIIGDSEGDSMEAYTYSGTFATKSAEVIGTAVVSSDGLTATFKAI